MKIGIYPMWDITMDNFEPLPSRAKATGGIRHGVIKCSEEEYRNWDRIRREYTEMQREISRRMEDTSKLFRSKRPRRPSILVPCPCRKESK